MKEQTPKQIIVDGIPFHSNHATELNFQQLHSWIIWQAPHQKDKGLYGAIHPPIASHGWYPAVILPKEKRVQVHAHLNTLYKTPEEAIESLKTNP